MKCKRCNGTGIDDDRLICYKCGGTGEYDENEVDRFNAVDFIKVMEMVKKPQTNEEWFCQLPLTKKSEFLAKMVNEAIEVHGKHGATWHESTIWWDGWLKQPHNP